MPSAAYNYLTLPYPMAMGDATGANGVIFTNLSEPPVLPEFTIEKKVVLHEMGSPALGVRGNRVLEVYQTSVNWWDVEFTADMITPAQLATMRSWSDGSLDPTNPGYVTYTPGGITSALYYLGVLAEDLKPTNYRYNGRMFHRVHVKAHILGASSIGGINP